MASLVYSLFFDDSLLKKLPFLLLFLLVHSHLCHGTEPQIQSKFRVLDLLPNNSCSSPQVSDSSTLRVVHPFGPCSPFNLSHKLSHHQILAQDGARAALLRRRIAMITSAAADVVKATELPVQVGRSFGTFNYLVTVGVGTPRRDLTVIFDTGSDFSWIQCRPCSPCYRQAEPLFDPAMSSTYATIPCNSSECKQVDHSTGCSADAASRPWTCRYEIIYGDLSESSGTIGHDTLRLGATAEVPGFVFGCGHSNKGIFGRVAGLMGLGRGRVSLAAQVSPPGSSSEIFSYCLPRSESSSGFLAFGRSAVAVINATYTPMLTQLPSFYFVDMVAIEVDGKRLPIPRTAFPAFGTVMDSGTVITQLPWAAYEVLRSEFRRQMRRYREAPALSVLDTCYEYTGTRMWAPTVALVFGGGAVLEVGAAGILYVAEQVSRACLAFRRSSSGLSLIGNMQQIGSEVIYDIANSKIGFHKN